VVEAIVAAVIGGVLAITGTRMADGERRNRESGEAVVRLTVAVESVSKRLEQIHLDLKAGQQELKAATQETFSRVTGLEQRVTRLETVVESATSSTGS
jgi:outer membrane murein-binding lipoprotein Lpp